MLIAGGILSLALAVVASFFLFSLRSGAGLGNYALLDQANREAMDRMTSEIRQAKEITSFSTNPPSITILNGADETITYMFLPDQHQMVRNASDGDRRILLENCSLLQFSMFQRNPSNATFGVFPVASNSWRETGKMIQLTWKTAITNSPYPNINSENVQTARIVIRKQRNDS
jgi:hypothetical protein